MKPLVSVITGTIPGREEMLAECVASVAAQTFTRFEHLVLLDADLDGCAATYNRLADATRGEWLFVLADDDLALPDCLATHLAHSAQADIVYSRPTVEGRESAPFHGEPPAIPAHALIRRETWVRFGGYDQEWGREEDRRFYIRALEGGARFVLAEGEPTWVYRLHSGSKSHAGYPFVVAA